MSAKSKTIGSPEPIAALNRVRITEYRLAWEEREPLVDIRNYCPDVCCNDGICPYLRQSVADKLNQAQASLPPGYRLKVGTALRTLSMQQRGWNGYFKRMQEEHPSWPLSALRRATNKYHAPYDQKAPPGHCTGGAVDVGLLDPDGNALDMVAPTQGWEAVDTFSDKISPESRANRMLMVEAMLGAGFSNCRDEYWHYSWGDSAWAVRVGESECPYGWTYAPPALETDFPGAAATNLHIETIRDYDGKPVQVQARCVLDLSAGETSEGDPCFAVGLYWARDMPVILDISTHYRLDSGIRQDLWPTSPLRLWLGDGKETWEGPLPCEAYTSDFMSVYTAGWIQFRLEPAFDRAVLTTRKQESKSEPACEVTS